MGITNGVNLAAVKGRTERCFRLKQGGNHERTLSKIFKNRRLAAILEGTEGDHRPVAQSQSLPTMPTYESLSEKEKEGILFSNLKFGSSNRAATSSDVWGAFKEWLMTCGGMCRD